MYVHRHLKRMAYDVERTSAAGPAVDQLLTFLKRIARRLLGRPPTAVAVTIHPFDVSHGVDTSGLLERDRLRTGHDNDTHNTAYFGVPPSRFMHAVERWRATPGTPPTARYRFIDIGCGKGRAVLLASRMLFRDVIGIELHPELAETARLNLERWRERTGVGVPASILCADAPTALHDLLSGATLLYVYNPFRAPVLRQLLLAILAQHKTLSEPVDLLYLYPEHEEVFLEFPQFERLWHEQIALSSEDEGDGISVTTDPCSLYRLLPRH